MKLSEIHGEKCLDMFADLIEPIAEIMSDKEIAEAAKKENKAAAVSVAIRNHKKAVIEVMAILDGENPVEYAEKINIFTLPAKLLEILNEPEILNLFQSQGQKTE